MSLNALLPETHHKKKKQKQLKTCPPKLAPPVIPIPPDLLPQEAAGLRSLVSLFDTSVSGLPLSESKQKAMIHYLSEYITKYNTPELRNLIPELAESFSDEEETIEEEALRTGENLEETDDETDEDNEEAYTAEDIAFIAEESEIEYEDGYDPEEDAKKQRRIEKESRKRKKKRIVVEEED